MEKQKKTTPKKKIQTYVDGEFPDLDKNCQKLGYDNFNAFVRQTARLINADKLDIKISIRSNNLQN